jgi:hypothetical protein
LRIRGGWSTGSMALTNLLLLYVLMHRQVRRVETRQMAATLAKLAVAGTALVGVCWAALQWVLPLAGQAGVEGKAGALFATITLADAAFPHFGNDLPTETPSPLRLTTTSNAVPMLTRLPPKRSFASPIRSQKI